MLELINIKEPKILFGHNQRLEDPRDGLMLYGPMENLKPYGIISGVVSTKEGLTKFKEFLEEIKNPIYNYDNTSRPFFPGFNAIFNMEWSNEKIYHINVEDAELTQRIYHEEVHNRTYNVVSLFADKIIKAKNDDDVAVNLWIVIIPDIVYETCRPQGTIDKSLAVGKKTISKSKAKKLLVEPSLFPEDNTQAEPYAFDANFHNQLKARLLKHTVPTQIIRESTLSPNKYLNSLGYPKRDFSKIRGHLAWSISTAAFYKTGGRPWKIADIREGVCYLGLVYKKDERQINPKSACCAAQMFLDSGDGYVFKGAVGPWYNPKFGEYHLKKHQAKELIELAVNTYKDIKGAYPSELFIHAKTKFNNDEWEGFTNGAGKTTKVVGITIKDQMPLKMYRDNSKFPILRGLAYLVNNDNGYLWTVGFVPRLDTSLASEVPNPLHIKISKGEADIKQVFSDILALTKLNYNACVYGDGKPVTLKFADAIGDILTAAPLGKEHPPLSFKYYI